MRSPLLHRIPSLARRIQARCMDSSQYIIPEFLDLSLKYCNTCFIPPVEKQEELLESYKAIATSISLEGVEQVVWKMLLTNKAQELVQFLNLLSEFYDTLEHIRMIAAEYPMSESVPMI